MENYIKLTQKPIDGILTINKNINMGDIDELFINNSKLKRKYNLPKNIITYYYMKNYIKLRQKSIDGILTINKNINMDNIKSIYINDNKMTNLNRRYNISTTNNENLIYDIVIELKKPINCLKLFYECYDIITINLTNFDTSKTTNMAYMFCGCHNLTSVTFGNNFNTSKVTNMKHMFNGCNNLTSLDLTNFNTSKVTNMKHMFDYCYNLTSLDLTHFDTSKVTSMEWMFNRCNTLTSLDLTNFNTSNVTDMIGMFSGCYKLTSLDLSNFDTSAVTDMQSMFSNCFKLTSLDLSNFDISNVNHMYGMFNGCCEIKFINIKNIKINEYDIILSQFLNNIKNIQKIIMNPKNNLLLYKKIKEMKYKYRK